MHTKQNDVDVDVHNNSTSYWLLHLNTERKKKEEENAENEMIFFRKKKLKRKKISRRHQSKRAYLNGLKLCIQTRTTRRVSSLQIIFESWIRAIT